MTTVFSDFPQAASNTLSSSIAAANNSDNQFNKNKLNERSYAQAQQQFSRFLTTPSLDQQVLQQPDSVQPFETVLHRAIETAYASPSSEIASETGSATEDTILTTDAAHQFLQRILYQINRLNFVWYTDLSQYTNERSVYLQSVRDRVEAVWQAWELSQLAMHSDWTVLQTFDMQAVQQALVDRAAADVAPPLSDSKCYIREQMTREAYRHLIAIVSLDGLVESSRLCHVLGGASNEVQATLIRVLLEEYGNGRLSRKHSTFFAQMMQELHLNPEPEAYLDWAPWQLLASVNHNFLLTQCKRHFLRYVGGFTYFEIVGPSIYQDYVAAASRLQLSETAMGYWELHIREDERHGQWMVHQAALPLAEIYPEQAWELVLGYDQEKYMSDRAGAAVLQAVKQAQHSS